MDPMVILELPPHHLTSVLPILYAQLLRSETDPDYVGHSTHAIKMRISSNINFGGHTAYDEFSKVAVQTGLVKTMLALTQRAELDSVRASASYQAMDTIARLMTSGTTAERRSLLNDLVQRDAVKIGLDKMDHPLCLHRQVAANFLRTLTTESFLGEIISGAQAADIIVKLSEFTASGPDAFIKQFTSPSTSWQTSLAIGRELTLPQAKAYAPRYFGLTQENAMWALHGLLCRDPPPTHQTRLDILRHKPEVIDLLFKCASLRREPWYPENQCDSVACEVIALLFMDLLERVPGVHTVLPDAAQAADDGEAEAFNESLQILFSRNNWVENIFGVYKRLDDEKWQESLQFFKRVTRDYLAVQPPGEDMFVQIFEYRGTSRICMLRLIASATYASDLTAFTDANIVSLLWLAHLSAQRAQKSKPPQSITSKPDLYLALECTQEIHREPLYTRSVPQSIEAPQVVPPELVLGPIAMLRLLTLLAQRDLLSKISGWQRLPEGTVKSVTLRQIQQVASDETIGKLLKYSMKAVAVRREKGTEIMKKGKLEDAGGTYMTAAEFAAALLAFDEATKGKWRTQLAGARSELVKSLGNAAEMSYQRGKYRRALRFATGAIEAGEGASDVDPALMVKNKRRFDAAKSHLP
ncbi:hypothetical protein AB1N83_001391 [Pleurotus pulmonarius]